MAHGVELRWGGLDVDLSVPALINQMFSSRKVMARPAGQRNRPQRRLLSERMD
jgi:hypothetical protein